MATANEISRALIAQGANAGHMAAVLESLSDGNHTPVWGAGAVGASLTPDEVAMIVMGSTAPRGDQAGAHAVQVSELIRTDGGSFGHVLTKVLSAEPDEIDVEEIVVSVDGCQASIKYRSTSRPDYFTAHGDLMAFSTATVVKGSILQALALKLSRPTEGGWVKSDESKA